ncbi:hypothetical protein BHM03_00057505 [Ensete ventricosum]|nr:hypothetical protein BHM03_00057505 [Ensete ventricosum]
MSPGGDVVQRIVVEWSTSGRYDQEISREGQHIRRYPVRDVIIRKYDQELLGAPLRLQVPVWDLIIHRYDRSSWRVGLLQCSHSLKGARQVRGQDRVVEKGEEAMTSPEGLSYPKAMHRSDRRWTRRSVKMPQRRIHQLRRKGYKCKATDSRAMGLAATWYRRGGTSVESSIPCSHGGRVLVVKGAKEVENAEANFKY